MISLSTLTGPAQMLRSGMCILAVALTALLAGCNARPQPPDTTPANTSQDSINLGTNSPQLAALKMEAAQPAAPAQVPLPGRLIWDEDATVRVFTPFAGIVRKLFVDVNQAVTNGMPLAEIQSPDFSQARADARKAQSEFRRASQNVERLRDLFQHGAAPRKDVESAEADYDSAQAEKDRAEARLAIYGATATSSGQDFLLPSPLSGVLVEKNVTPGQEVRPDQMLANMPQFTAPLFVVTDPARLWIQIDATETDVARLHLGDSFTFSTPAFTGQTFTGRVAVISDFIDPATRTVKVRGRVENPRRLLRAEMFVTVNLPAAQPAGTSVSAKAVFLDGENHYVFVEQAPGQFARRQVQLGDEQAGRVQVLAGLQPGQRVVTDGCILLEQTLK